MRRAPDLLRAGDRRRGGASSTGTPRCAERSTGSRAPPRPRSARRAGRGHPPPGAHHPARRLLQRRAAAGRVGHPLPRPPQGRPAQRALPRERAAHRPPAASHRRGLPAVHRQAARPVPRDEGPGSARCAAQRRAGKVRTDDGDDLAPYFPYTTMGRVRLDHLQDCLDTVRTESVAGDLVECGTGRGGGGVFLRGYLAAVRHAGPDGVGGRRVPGRRRGHRRAPTMRPSAAEPGCPTSRPTSTWSATRSSASTCSTSGCGSSRARSATRSTRRPSRSSRCCASARTSARPPPRPSTAVYDRGHPRRVRGHRPLRRHARSAARSTSSAPGAASPSRSSGSTAPAPCAGARPSTAPVAPVADAPAERGSGDLDRGVPAGRRAARRVTRTSPSSSSSTTCGARPRAPCTRSLAPTSRGSTTSTTR